MVDLVMTWQEAAVTAAAVLGAAVVARGVGARRGRPRLVAAAAVGRESALLLGLFALWQLAGRLSMAGPAGALARAAWIWDMERWARLPSEAATQAAVLGHPLIVQACNLYYASLHFPVLIACLAWLFARHRRSYRPVRTTMVLFTASSLLIQLIPVAPPRMLPGARMIDTAVAYGQSVYGSVGGFDPDQLSAMPSVHIGWALLVAVAVVQVSRSRWRWLALGYPVLTTLIVVVTANHFWADGIVAAALLALALLAQRAWRAVHRRVAGTPAGEPAPRPAPTPAAARTRKPAPTPAAALVTAPSPAPGGEAAQRGQHGGRLLPRWQLREQLRRGLGDLRDRPLDRDLGAGRHRLDATDLAHVLARCGLYLGIRRLRLQAPEDGDVAAHTCDGTRKRPFSADRAP